MLKKIFITCLAIAFTNFLFAQVKWPAITQQTKPWTRWWWQGSAVDKANLTAAMQMYQQAGLGGAVRADVEPVLEMEAEVRPG